MNLAQLLRGRSAHAIAFLALIFALGGSAYAIKKNSVTSKAIENGTIKDKDVKAEGLTGASIAESTLGTVPDATRADSADTATNATNATNAASADTVSGQRIAKVQYKVAPTAPASTIFAGGGLTISAACAATADTTVTATTTKTDSSIYATISGDGVPVADAPLQTDLEGQDFDPGDTFAMQSTGNGDVNLIHFVYQAPDGTVVDGILALDEFGTNFCTVTGHVIFG